MNRIQRVSLFFKMLFQIIFIGLPILLVISWIYAPEQLILLNGIIKFNAIPASYSGTHVYPHGLADKSILHTLSISERIFGFFVSLIPTLIQMFIVYSLVKLFTLYAKGEIFSINHVRYTRYIGYALLLSQIIEPFYQFAMGIVLTLKNPPGYHYAAITLDQANVGIVLTAIILILISWILTEGCKIHEEVKLTV